MTSRGDLTDAEWAVLEPLLPSTDNRRPQRRGLGRRQGPGRRNRPGLTGLDRQPGRRSGPLGPPVVVGAGEWHAIRMIS
ncbi:hypothetical protein ACFWMJ_11790 [Streptomyces hawaiiensis]|uniref:hypothetical protein n=1 Tax=Streptomyces hawaiiensis TaxID=67305 RepID=UPI00364FCE0D